MDLVIATVAAVFIALGLASGVLRGRAVTAPMLAVVAGVLLGPVAGVLPTELDEAGVLLLVELALALLLFVDATRVDLRLARRNGQVPARMLLLALPLAIALGTLAGVAVLGLAAAPAFVLACMVAPTDAALAQPLMTDERVPQRIRQAINVESGLNDGLVVPFLAVALVAAGGVHGGAGAGGLADQVVRLLGGGLLVGGAVGLGVGGALRAIGWRTLQPAARQVGTAAVPLLAFAGARLVEGNGFIAAFVAGVALGAVVDDAHELVEFGEDAGELLALLTFLVFGAVFVDAVVGAFGVRAALYAVLSLTVVRMLPIAASLVGLGLRWDTRMLLGWFGPRGLATIVFALEVLDVGRGGGLEGADDLFGVAAMVVVASVVVHGFTAAPLAGRYAARLARAADEGAMPERVAVVDLPVRRGRSGR